MTKVTIHHSIKPTSFKNKPIQQKWFDTLIGFFYYGTVSSLLTKLENCVCLLLFLIIAFLIIIGCKNYIWPLVSVIKL